ncbi:MAG: NAD-dependent epimerase/dehydratase family protein [Burkholderiales bacterium]
MSPRRGRLLVTGASGFLGRAASAALQQRGWAVVPAVRTPRDANSVRLDLSDLSSLERLSNLQDIRAIIHVAAKVDFTASAISEFFDENIAAIAVLLSIARSWSAQMIFTSTALIGETPVSIINGNFGAASDNPYTMSKWLGEMLASASGVDTTVLRYGGIFGWNGPTHIGLNRAIAAAAQGTPPQ